MNATEIIPTCTCAEAAGDGHLHHVGCPIRSREHYSDWAKKCGIDKRCWPDVAGGLSQGTGTGSWFRISHTLEASKAPGMVLLDSVSPVDSITTIYGEMCPDVAETIAASLLYHAAEARKHRCK